MDVVTLVEEARRDGVKFEVIDGELLVTADATKDHLVKRLTRYKPEIIELLGGNGQSDEPPESSPAATRNERFQPFPTDALPEPIRGLVEASAKAIGCDLSYLTLPIITVLAAAIGNTRQIQPKPGWTEPAIIWTAIVGESGTSKTPAFKLVMRPLRDRQHKSLELYTEAMKQHDIDLAHHDKAMAAWKRDKNTNDPPPIVPDPPQAERFIVSDTTVEALAPLLQANPRGLLMARDELAGWIGSFDRYAGGKGADSTHWLSMHGGESITVDRKTGNPRTIFVPQAAVSVTGGIQPGTLHRALGIEHRESGLAARLLLTCPPRKVKRWTEADMDPELEAAYARVLERLYNLEAAIDGEGNSQPVVVRLTPDAKEAFIAYYNEHAKEQIELSGDLAAAWSKLEAYPARFAMVIHLVRWAANDPSLKDPDKVDRVSMEAGIKLAQWFKNEARRVYAMLSESDDDRHERWLIERIERKGGSVTARDLMRSSHQWPTALKAEAALDDLVTAKYGRWVEQTPSSKGGRPTRVFVLAGNADTDTTPLEARENGSCVNVDAVDKPEKEWGEV
jgi:hypothetical protein